MTHKMGFESSFTSYSHPRSFEKESNIVSHLLNLQFQKLPWHSTGSKGKGYITFFVSNTFISNAMLKLAKNQVNARQHPEAELLLFENY